MNVIFTNTKCKICSIRLTEYEESEKQGLCIDCFKEKIEEINKGTGSM